MLHVNTSRSNCMNRIGVTRNTYLINEISFMFYLSNITSMVQTEQSLIVSMLYFIKLLQCSSDISLQSIPTSPNSCSHNWTLLNVSNMSIRIHNHHQRRYSFFFIFAKNAIKCNHYLFICLTYCCTSLSIFKEMKANNRCFVLNKLLGM